MADKEIKDFTQDFAPAATDFLLKQTAIGGAGSTQKVAFSDLGVGNVIVRDFDCSSGVAVPDAVYINGSDSVDKADANGSGTFPVIGFVIAKVTSVICTVQFIGESSVFSGLTAGSVLFLSEIAGEITLTAPTTPGSIVQKVGVARDATTLKITADAFFTEL